MRRGPRLLAFGLAALLAASACTGPEGAEDKKDSPGAAANGDVRVAVVTHGTAGDAFWDVVKNGAEVLVLAAATGQDGYDSRPVLDDAGWEHLVATIAEITEVAAGHGVRTTLHPHVGTMVETAPEVERLLATSGVPLCLDTGHLLIGGADPLGLALAHADRIGHVHLKDVDAHLADRVRRGELSYLTAVRSGLYRPLGDGDVPVGDIVSTLESAGYLGWYVLEQDTALETGDEPQRARPRRDTARSLDFLARVTG